jgi:hypothetical protein
MVKAKVKEEEEEKKECTCGRHTALLAKYNALLAEKSALELKLFWNEYTTTQLQTAMQWGNRNDMDGPNCSCLACTVSGRKDEEKKTSKRADCCTFKPYFEALLAEYGLTVGYVKSSSVACEHDAAPDGNMVYDNDAHLVHCGRDDWVSFTYGAKLWRASSCQDPELQKLVCLFEVLQRE